MVPPGGLLVVPQLRRHELPPGGHPGWANGLANNSKFWYSLLVKTYPEVEGMDPGP